jgi:hypothetical protein
MHTAVSCIWDLGTMPGLRDRSVSPSPAACGFPLPRRVAPILGGTRQRQESEHPASLGGRAGERTISIIPIWTLGTIAVFVRSDTLSRDRRRPLERTLIMFQRTHGKPHTETYRFSATPTLSDFPLLIGEMVRLSDLRFKRQAQRRSLFQKIGASWAIRSTPKQEF